MIAPPRSRSPGRPPSSRCSRLLRKPNRDRLRLYAWTLPQLDQGLTSERSEQLVVEIAGKRQTFTRETTSTAIGWRPARMISHACPSFLWTNGPAVLTDTESGEVLWDVTVLETSRP